MGLCCDVPLGDESTGLVVADNATTVGGGIKAVCSNIEVCYLDFSYSLYM